MSRTLKLVGIVLSLFLILIVLSQIYFVNHEKCTYNVAIEYSVSQSISCKAVIVREETVIQGNGAGVYDFRCSDGSKVSAGSVIADRYSSKAEILSKQKKDDYEAQIAGLEEAQSYQGVEYKDAESIEKQINDRYGEMTNHIQLGEYELAESDKRELRILMNKYNIVTGVDSSYQQLIDSLNGKIELVSQVYREPVDSVVSQKGGYFVSSTDGYEDKLNYETIYTMDSDDIQSIIDGTASPVEGAIGKCFDSYSCKLIGVVNTDNSYFADTYVKVKLSSSSNIYDVYVEKVEKINDDGDCIVILNCDMIDSDIIKNRVEQIQIVFDDYKGIKVPRKAIRFKDGSKGVYIIYGEDYIFKKIDVIYEGDDFVLSAFTDDEEYLMLYDQIVLEGQGVGK